MTDTSMIERVARAVFEQPHITGDIYAPSWDTIREKDRDTFREIARSDIEAMKIPTFEMVEAPAGLEIDPGTADDVWQSMIDKALES